MLLFNVLQEALQHSGAHRLYITHVFKDFDCDVHFPDFDKNVFKEIRSVDYSKKPTYKNLKFKSC